VRYLIVNADDFGMTDGINRGIIEAHRRGIVTSASLMVKQPMALQAANLAGDERKLGLGLHIDLTEWELVDGEWRQIYARVDVDDPKQVAAEIANQLEGFRALVGRMPDHIDSHQHVHLEGVVRHEAERVAQRLGVPLRRVDPRVAFCGDFYGQQRKAEPYPAGVTVPNLLHLIAGMDEGWTELMCHPGYARDLSSTYAKEREIELEVLCEPELRTTLRMMQTELRSFTDLVTGE
jgi:chitin disaccharide deacetylase